MARTSRQASLHRLMPTRAVADVRLAPATADGSQGWTQEHFAGLWNSYLEEESYSCAASDVEGTIPSDLKGTFFRNGPGVFDINGQPLHVFDGHGLVASVAIRDGTAHFRSRYVRTPVYEEEMEQHCKVLYRGFGTQKPGGMLANMFDIRDKPVANTALIEWAGKLWALWEASRPFTLDPDTLETLGEDDLGGVLPPDAAFCAHPQVDLASGRLVAFGLGLRHAEGKLHIYELEPDGAVAVHKTLPISMNPPLYVHDFMITPSWYVFFEPPLRVKWSKLGGYLLGRNEQTQMVAFDQSRPGKWMLIPRGREGEPLIIETPPQFIWHYASASEDPATGDIQVDACVFDEFAPGDFNMRVPETIPRGTLRRSIIKPAAGTALTTETLSRAADFPRTNPAYVFSPALQFVYLAASSNDEEHFPFTCVIKQNVITGAFHEWRAPHGCFVGEAVFVPKAVSGTVSGTHDGTSVSGRNSHSGDSIAEPQPGSNAASQQHSAKAEDDGYLLTLMYDGSRRRSSLVILDAQHVEAGPVALVHMKQALPFAFHCMWSTNYHGPR